MLRVDDDLTCIPGTVFLVEHLSRKSPISRIILPPPLDCFTGIWHDLLLSRLTSCYKMPARSIDQKRYCFGPLILISKPSIRAQDFQANAPLLHNTPITTGSYAPLFIPSN